VETSYYLARFYFQRTLGAIYCVGFLIVFNQFRALCGRTGILPMPLFLNRVNFWDAPSLLWLNSSNAFILILSGIGVALSIFAMTGYSDAYGTVISMSTWFLLWILYMSFVNVGQTFYSFGWEILLIETGFLAIFMGPSSPKPSLLMNILLQWLLFRHMFGAGLIKIRGDECWRDLTCLKYHYETMPLPGPTSRYFYYLPMWFQKGSVLYNHLVELIIPFFYFGPRVMRHTAGVVTFVFQIFIILSGNFSWLNHITLVIAIACFDDSFFTSYLPKLIPWAKSMGVAGVDGSASVLSGGIPTPVIYILTALVAYLSIAPVRNLISSKQVMNTSFDPLHLVNTYGAFGSITKVRNEVILEGANDLTGPWKEYEFKGKPGDVSKTPPWVSPYHYKLDWQMWFAAMTPYYYHPWILSLIGKILQNNTLVLDLMGPNPYPDHPPKYIRASLYEYRYTTLKEKNTWKRTYVEEYLPPLSLDDPKFKNLLREQGWLEE
jgi:hypothetical protein